MRSRGSDQTRFQSSLKTNNYAQWVSTTSAYRPQARRQPSAKPARRGNRLWMFFGIVGLALFLSAHSIWAQHAAAQKAAAQAAAEARAAQFKTSVNTLLAAHASLDVSVAVASDGQSPTLYGTSAAYDGASTGKLLTAADYLHHVQNGSASLTQQIAGKRANAWLEAMIVESDDTAWQALNDYLGHDDLAQYATSIGFTQYNAALNTFPVTDIAILLQKLYGGSLLAPSEKRLLLQYMQRANYRNYIVAAIPTSDTVYHKIGMDADDVHDASIISNGQHWMVLVIFTNGHGTYNWDKRAELMQTITKQAITAYLPS